uniref:SRCR domain-containing protein n=1 Tax=Amphimedon queenslandica TaxID=400682 RepID=A0A1X7STL2_AMPQE
KIRNSNGTPHRGYGRVEVCSGGQWGTVCDDYWGWSDARVACASLGYSRDRVSSYCCASLGQGYGSIFLDNLHCSGNEASLFSCPHNGVSNHNCGHNEDAGVQCYGITTPSSCTNGDLKLWRPSDGPEYYGIALYCKNNVWVGVCDDSWKCDTARLICQQLGFAGSLGIRGEGYWGYFYYQGVGVDHYAWSCNSGHKSLSQCSYYYHSSCYSYHDQLGIICYPNVQGSQCTNGDVQLQDGTNSTNGRAMYCFEGYWTPLCSISASTASAICQTLGFTSPYAIVYTDERFGTSERRSGLSYVNCPAGATNISSQCTPVYKTWSNGCYISYGKCYREAGIQCFNASQDCIDGSVRLVNGVLEQEGRVEVCSYGLWGTVCQDDWNAIDAYIVCKQLGYTGTGPLSYYNSKFGVATHLPTVYNNVKCVGWEKSITECTKNVYPAGSCSQSQTASVVCKEGCRDGEVRLLGGGFENEGTVQICYGGLWGLVSDNQWDVNDANVVCYQLGFGGGNALAILNNQYGKPNMTIHIRNVACLGNETFLDNCTK